MNEICVECGLSEKECKCTLGYKGVSPEKRERLHKFISDRKIMEIPWIKEWQEDQKQ